MKTIFLKQLRLKNFKGIFDRAIEFSVTTNISGDNETGKSTLDTAWHWLLTGKDEFDRKDYEIKNTARPELNQQSHEVEGMIFVTDGGVEFEYKLKRVYLEKWVRQKGETHKTFKGHETEFYVNDVKCSATEYQTTIDSIIPANIIKLITNPYYFNTLPWEKQRAGLLQLVGEISNDQIIDSIATPQNDFSTLIMVLNSGKSLEKYKDEIRAKKKILKDKSIEFQPRIDELKRSKPDERNWSDIESSISATTVKINNIDKQLTNASEALKAKQQVVLGKQRELHTKQTELQSIRFKIKTEQQQKDLSGGSLIKNIESEITAVKNLIATYQRQIADNNTNKAFYEKQIADKEAVVLRLRTEWDKINAEKFEFDENSNVCPSCKQTLPEETISSKKNQLLENFFADVRKRKQEKVDYSNQVKAEIAQLKEKIALISNDKMNACIASEQTLLNELEQKLSTHKLADSKVVVTDIETRVDALIKVNGDALNLNDDIDALEKEIAAANEALNSQDNTSAQTERKQQLNKELDQLKLYLADRDTIAKTDKRIAELMSEEAANAQEIASLEKQEYDIDAFSHAKMNILEERVNKMFTHVKFQLFDQQVNGSIVETCVCKYLDVPYPTLNTAAKVLAGLDILNTLSNFYGVHAPVFIDNRESTTWIPEIGSQVISLFVVPGQKELRIDHDVTRSSRSPNKKQREAA